jgi:pimeloyl-ACP methyl ester carboxylesterase
MLKSWNEDMRRLAEGLRTKKPDTPALLLWGELDPIVPASTGADLMAHLDNCEKATMPGVGHLPIDERPEECGSLIRTWLAAAQESKMERIKTGHAGSSDG